MDGRIFDRLTCAASEATSRRGALKLMASAALAAALGKISPVTAKKNGKGKGKGKHKKKRKCRALNQGCGGKQKTCCQGLACTNGACTCPSGMVEVNGTCVSPPPAPQCTVAADCGANEICVGGRCVLQQPECTVNNDCGIGEICVDGTCVLIDVECQGDDECDNNKQCVNGSCECLEIEDGRCIRRCDVQDDCPGATSQCQNLAPEPSPLIVDGVCVDQPFLLCSVDRCTTNNDCQADEVCVMQDCDGPDPVGVCYPFSVLP